MNRPTHIAAALLLSAAMPAFAQVAAPAAGTAAARARQDAHVDRFCPSETGTRIRTRKVDAQGRCTSAVSGRVYTQDDLRATGQTDIANALRMLDPSIR